MIRNIVIFARTTIIPHQDFLHGHILFSLDNPVSSEISDLLLFFSYFACQNKEIKSGN